MPQKYIAWFSCGAPSAVAAMLAIREFGHENVRVIRQDTGSEHPDNERFMADFIRWTNHPVEVTKSKNFENVDDVIDKTGWIAGAGGARCTGELKKIPAQDCINWGKGQEIEILGYTIEEKQRVTNWIKNNKERKIDPILIRRGLTKGDCKGVLWKAGIKLPIMYELGYNNNNCIGCVKGGAGYWNKIRNDFPEVFNRRAKQERDKGATMLKVQKEADTKTDWPDWVKALPNADERIADSLDSDGRYRFRFYLDEMPPDYGNHLSEGAVSCGLICMLAA